MPPVRRLYALGFLGVGPALCARRRARRRREPLEERLRLREVLDGLEAHDRVESRTLLGRERHAVRLHVAHTLTGVVAARVLDRAGREVDPRERRQIGACVGEHPRPVPDATRQIERATRAGVLGREDVALVVEREARAPGLVGVGHVIRDDPLESVGFEGGSHGSKSRRRRGRSRIASRRPRRAAVPLLRDR